MLTTNINRGLSNLAEIWHLHYWSRNRSREPLAGLVVSSANASLIATFSSLVGSCKLWHVLLGEGPKRWCRLISSARSHTSKFLHV